MNATRRGKSVSWRNLDDVGGGEIESELKAFVLATVLFSGALKGLDPQVDKISSTSKVLTTLSLRHYLTQLSFHCCHHGSVDRSSWMSINMRPM